MNLIKSITDFFSKKKEAEETGSEAPQAPDGVCGICWGREEYEGKFNELSHKELFNRKNIHQKQAFIQDFVTTHVEGIKLVTVEDEYECQSCKTRFPIDDHEHF